MGSHSVRWGVLHGVRANGLPSQPTEEKIQEIQEAQMNESRPGTSLCIISGRLENFRIISQTPNKICQIATLPLRNFLGHREMIQWDMPIALYGRFFP